MGQLMAEELAAAGRQCSGLRDTNANIARTSLYVELLLAGIRLIFAYVAGTQRPLALALAALDRLSIQTLYDGSAHGLDPQLPTDREH